MRTARRFSGATVAAALICLTGCSAGWMHAALTRELPPQSATIAVGTGPGATGVDGTPAGRGSTGPTSTSTEIGFTRTLLLEQVPYEREAEFLDLVPTEISRPEQADAVITRMFPDRHGEPLPATESRLRRFLFPLSGCDVRRVTLHLTGSELSIVADQDGDIRTACARAEYYLVIIDAPRFTLPDRVTLQR